MTIGLVRFDVEDYLTRESDDALVDMMRVMRRSGVPASYGVVGKKMTALHDHQAHAAIAMLAEELALGFHSYSHSEHPTIAEELALLSYDQGVEAFINREQPGVEAIARYTGREPRYFTQPGGNWVPHTVDALPKLGMPIFFSDAWNSYLIESSEPMWYGSILHLAPPVVTPRPFLLGLPNNLDQALGMADQIAADHPTGVVMVMLHPTELVSTQFWDADNFGHGQTAEVLRPAPLRTSVDRAAAHEAFERYIRHLSSVPGVTWLNVMDLVDQIHPRHAVPVARAELLNAMTHTGLGPTRFERGSLSAAQMVWALANFVNHSQVQSIEVPLIEGPKAWAVKPHQKDMVGGVSSPHLLEACLRIVQCGQAEGRIPGVIEMGQEVMPIEGIARLALAHLRREDAPAPTPLTFLEYVKPQDQLHWSWPIFSHSFEPVSLWNEARRLAWSLAPVEWR